MLKNITIIELGRGEKKFPLHLNEPTTFAELFDVAIQLREFALKGIQEAAKADEPQQIESTPPTTDIQDVVVTDSSN